ncbi:MAG: uracil-DNA glycosylase [Gammaproteobacteria bacterium]
MDSVVSCRRCHRLVSFTRSVQQQYPHYYCAPVASFGDERARLLIVGLAPGKHGANASGRPFTGDASGDLLFRTLHKYGFANQPASTSIDDGMILNSCRITNAVKCLPPQNKPRGEEIDQCNAFLKQELESLPAGAIVVALGAIAHKAIVKAFNLAQSEYRFAHHARHQLAGGLCLFDSYHCSRYNTQTRRLTVEMFEHLFSDIRKSLGHA